MTSLWGARCAVANPPLRVLLLDDARVLLLDDAHQPHLSNPLSLKGHVCFNLIFSFVTCCRITGSVSPESANSNRGREEGDRTENVINCRQLLQIFVTFYDEFYDKLCHMNKVSYFVVICLS